MTETNLKAIERHNEIVKLVLAQGFVNTEELVEKFDVSPQTIRRDLNELANCNQLKRSHGGATIITSSENSSYQERKISYQEQKQKIARKLVKHIPNNATLFIDIGTTPEAIAKALLLSHQNLRVVTNNINVATLLMPKTDFKVILAGGEVRHYDGGVTGEATIDFISQFRLDFGILGISGIDYDGSLLDFDYHEVRIKRTIIENSRRVYLGVDHSKFGRNAMVKLGRIEEADLIITDQSPPEEICAVIHEHQIPLEIVGTKIVKADT